MNRFILIVLLLLPSNQILADTNETLVFDYAPYLNGKPWPRWPVVAYIETASNLWVHPTDPNHFPTIQDTFDAEADFTTIILKLPDGSTYKTYNNFVLGPSLSAVYMGDFNNDGKPDFVAVKYGAGNGLAAEDCTGVFAFSENGNYRFTRVRTMDLNSDDLVVDPTTKHFRFIETSFRQGMTLDGQYHSFWVHRFFSWDGSGFQEDTVLPPCVDSIFNTTES
jgi:hypothetical protein